MISLKVSELDLIALKRNSAKILNNTIMIVLIAKGTQGLYLSEMFSLVLVIETVKIFGMLYWTDHPNLFKSRPYSVH